MISNYPYFGLPNYLRYMNPEPYRYVPPEPYARNRPFKPPVNASKYNKNNYSTNTSSAVKSSYTNNRQEHSESLPRNFELQDRSFQGVQPIFNLMGINVYFDDVLIICILFFLYNEGVNDPYLFLVLVLLLMS